MSDFKDPVLNHHVGVTIVSPKETTYEHDHDFHEAFLVTDGEGVHHLNGEPSKLARGHLVWVNPQDRHAFSTCGSSYLKFINLAFTVQWWNDFQAMVDTPPGIPIELPASPVALSPSSLTVCTQAMLDLFSTERKGLALTRSITCIVDELLRSVRNSGPSSTQPAWFSKWLDLLRNEATLSMPFAILQRHAGVSAEHLARTCRQQLNQTPTDIINAARIGWVQARLLAGRERSIDLAFDIGFNNVGYFYRCFRKYSGCTPDDWRRRHQDDCMLPRHRH